MIVRFIEPIAFFVSTKLNNYLLASDTNVWAEMLCNRSVQVDISVPNVRAIVDKVLEEYEGEFTLV